MVRLRGDRGNHRRDGDSRRRHRSRGAAHPRTGAGAARSRVERRRERPVTSPRRGARWLVVVLFATGMAWVEAACVYYLRVMVDRVEPYQANPLPMRGNLGPVE